VLAGESAGGNLVTSLAVASSYRRDEPWARSVFEARPPRAVLPACGLLQVSDPERFGRRKPLPRWVASQLEGAARAYLHGAAREGERFLDLADPLVALERGEAPERPLPPFFTAVGTKDPLLDDTRRLKAALDRLSVPCRARFYPGEVHAFHAFIWRSQARAYWKECFAFLGEVLAGERVRV
jgi:acetyl esterase